MSPATRTGELSSSWPMAWLARCATIYMLAYSAPQLVSTLPGISGLSDRWMSAVGFVARWFMAHALRLPEHSPPVPSWYLDHRPDDLTELVGCLLLAGVALLGGTIWTLFRPRGPAWGRWQSLAHLVTRFALASIMIGYGWSKLLPQQFNGGRVPPSWLLWRLGDFTPTHLLWIFMGYSRPYAVFTGAGEMLGALLLCARRTATAGALILIAILSNVVAMNLAYDVAVKVGAVNFLLMAAFIAAPDAARVANLLFQSRPDAQGWIALHLGRIRLRWIPPAASLLLTIWLVVSPLPSISENIGGLHVSRPALPPPAGLFEIHTRDAGRLAQPSQPWTQWDQLVLGERAATALTDQDSLVRYTLTRDTAARRLRLSTSSVPNQVFEFRYELSDSSLLLRPLATDGGEAIVLRKRESTLFRWTHLWAW